MLLPPPAGAAAAKIAKLVTTLVLYYPAPRAAYTVSGAARVTQAQTHPG
jgi:hypothetical protein